jgi:dTDP-4-amino-4,6-dideoxygalactose transaminase
MLDKAVDGLSCIRTVEVPQHVEHACYKHYMYVRPEQLVAGWSRDKIVAEISARGVPCFQGSCSEVYLEKAFDSTDWRPKSRLPRARLLGETSLMFLVHPTLSVAELEQHSAVIRQVLQQASR